MRITKKVFYDLAILMILLGIVIGIVFPFFCLILGVPGEIVLNPSFFIACMLAGVILASLNITLARKTVGSRITFMSRKMKQIETILEDRKGSINEEEFEPINAMIDIDSEDELGESAKSFNSLVTSLSEVLELNSEIQQFSGILTSHLEIDPLSREALNQLVKNTGAIGGAVFIEKGGELSLKAAVAIREASLLEKNERLLYTMKTHERQIIRFPDDIIINGIIVDFQPQELLVEPILYKNSILGVLILVCSAPFPVPTISKLKFFTQELSLVFRNAITHEQMTRFAAIDALTGLFNRRFGIRRLNEEFNRAIRHSMPLSVLMFDIDHFKIVNDTYGHLTGDKILVNVSKIALSAIREGDILLRYGGEEFLCILPGAGIADATMVAERIRNMIMNSHVKHGDQDIKVTVSIGAATYPSDHIHSTDQMIKLADEAMYEAKSSGRNRTVSF